MRIVAHAHRLAPSSRVTDLPEQSFSEFRRTGSAAALGRAFDATAPELLRIAAFLVPGGEIDDLVQDTFVVALRKRDLWQQGERLLPWLLGILANEARSRRRRRRLRARELAAAPPAAVIDPVAAAAAGEIEAAFETALQRLGRGDAELLRLHLRQELSCREISERLHRPAGTVRTQMARAMSALRARLPAGLAVAAFPLAPAVALPALRARVLAEAANAVRAASATKAAAAGEPAAAPRLRWQMAAGASIVLVAALAIGAAQLWPQSEPAAAPAPAAPPPVAVERSVSPAPDRVAASDVPKPPPPRWLLRGAVRDEQGAPIAGATVTSYLRESGRQLAQTGSGADGRYELDLDFWRDRSPIDRGAYGIVAIARAPGTNDYTFLQPFAADADAGRPLVVEHDFELSPYPTLRGRVVDARGRGVPAHVNAFDPAGALVDTTDAGADGAFRIVCAGDGERVELDARHATGGRCRLAVGLRRGAEVDVGALVLEPGQPLGGRVTLQDGTPLADWPVFVRGDAGGYWYFEPRTDADGVYAANRPTACEWRVRATGFVGRDGDATEETVVAADRCRQDLSVPGVLLRFHCFDPGGRELLPQPLAVHVFAAGDAAAAEAARAGGADAFARELGNSMAREPMIVPCAAHVLVRGTGAGGLGVTALLTAPARGGVLDVPLHFAPAAAATLTVRARFADGALPQALTCRVVAGPGASPRAVEELGRAPGEVRLRCPVGRLALQVSAYPDHFDDAEERAEVTTTDGGEHTVELVLARRGTFAFVLRDAADGSRVRTEDVTAHVTVGDVEFGRFAYRDGDLQLWSSEPPIGVRATVCTLLPVGRHRVTFAVDGFAPAMVDVDVREVDAANLATGGDTVAGAPVEVVLQRR